MQLFVSLIQNLPTIIVEIVKAVPQIIAGIVNAFTLSMGQIVNIGKNIVPVSYTHLDVHKRQRI